jgi:hypothetical protein
LFADLNRHLAADAARDTARHADLYLTRYTAGLISARCIADAARNAVGDLASARLLYHRARRVGNPTRTALFDHPARRAGNPAGAALFDHLARCIGNFAGAALFNHAAASVRDLPRAALLNHRAGRIRNLTAAALLLHVAHRIGNAFRHRAWDLIAARVRDLAVMAFMHVPRTSNLALFDARAPDLPVADRRRARA